MDQIQAEPGKRGVIVYGQFVLVMALLIWSYWPPIMDMVERWNHDPQYSHGYLVPVFSLFVLWMSRGKMASANKQGSNWGIVAILAAIFLRLVGIYFYYTWLDPISLLPLLCGIVLLLGGWKILQWTWPAIVYLFFMIPLPYNVSISMAAPLQRIATEASTFLLQVLGCPAVAEGNVILLNEYELGVVEACSGLRMMVVFFAISTAVAMFLKRSLWEKAVIVASAFPIAVLSNILRITVTGVLYETAGKKLAEFIFHDLAGWLMMPMALTLLAAEIWLINHLLNKNIAQMSSFVTPASQVFTARIKRNRTVKNQERQSSLTELSVPESANVSEQ